MVKGLTGVPADIRLESFPDPGDRFTLGNVIGTGVSGTVYEAIDTQAGDTKVAIKIQKIIPDYEDDIREEYKILKYLPSHPNLPTFHGAYHTQNEVWFVLQHCAGGPIINLARALYAQNRHFSEDQIAFVLRETVQALCHLHENHIIHRDVKAGNILLTDSGEIKIVDFGLSRGLKNTLDKRNTCLGSPCWMAPELIFSGRGNADGTVSYDNRIDVWALGITALELAEGQAPYESMHPTRAIFQIVRNPPPNFRLPSKWTQNYADFVSECLIKVPEERPFVFEFLEHPFIKSIADKKNIGQELICLKKKIGSTQSVSPYPEVHLRNGRLQKKISEATETMIAEDLAAIDDINEEKIMNVLHERFKRGLHYTYIGDILIFLNPNSAIQIYGNKYHSKYQWKSRSDNSPHIYAIADGSYQDMLHHKESQNIVFSGESYSGKTTNYNHLLNHLLYLGKISNKISDKIEAATKVIEALGNAATPHNNNSTRHVLNTQITYTATGKLSGAIFYIYQLEKWRVTGYKCPKEGNFHIFYYFYDSKKADGSLTKYGLKPIEYKYLNRNPADYSENCTGGAVNTPEQNAAKYKEILHLLEILEFEPDQIEVVQKILAAIILLGEINFVEDEENTSKVENVDVATQAADLLGADEKKFLWALCNYCVIVKGSAVRNKQNVASAQEALRVLARGLYCRLVDFIVNIINLRISVTRVVLGDKNYINILDMPGFEAHEQNNLEQLLINSFNEQLQNFYNQRVFAWELNELEDEGIVLKPMQYYDNQPTVDELLGKPDGLLYVIDEASKTNSGHSFIIDTLANSARGTRIRKATSTKFTVAHYFKRVEYNAQDFPTKNHDFLPPEMIETLRQSTNFVIKQLFTNQFTKSGNLTISTEQNLAIFSGTRRKWGAALVSGDQKSRKFNTELQGEYSQTRRMRSCCSIFRASSAEILKNLIDSNENSNVCFVRCIRAGFAEVGGFEPDIVSSQLGSLSILDTTRARQIGYSYRVSFKDFIDRYKFLAFDFNENVEVTRENCRLLLIRLKMEGWIIGKNKVFLRYYDKEYLSRLYETQVKKIVKIQAVMRKFITKKKVLPRIKSQQSIAQQQGGKTLPRRQTLAETVAIVRVFSGVRIRGVRHGPATPNKFKLAASKACTGNEFLELNTYRIIRRCFKKWKSKTLYQLLMLQHSKLVEDLFDFSLQVHFNNEKTVYQICGDVQTKFVSLNDITRNTTLEDIIENWTQTPLRIPLNLRRNTLYKTETAQENFSQKTKEYDESKNRTIALKGTNFIDQRQVPEMEDIQIQDLGGEIMNSERGRSVSVLTKEKYIGHCSQGEIRVHRGRLGKIRAREMYNDTTEYGEDSCAKVFMQLMCPSCCKGLFSETKGSVYMKRKSTMKSETKSVTMTICSDLDDGVKSVASLEAGATGPLNSNRTHSPIPEESEDKCAEKEPESMVFTAPRNEGKPKLVRDATFEEDVNVTDSHGVLQKHRSMSLSETISNTIQEELSQNLQHDDDAADAKWYNNKLRKTSFPNSNGNGHPRTDQKVGLKIGGKEYVEIEKQENEDEPPFNFQVKKRTTRNRNQRIRHDREKEPKKTNYENTEKYDECPTRYYCVATSPVPIVS